MSAAWRQLGRGAAGAAAAPRRRRSRAAATAAVAAAAFRAFIFDSLVVGDFVY